MPLDIQAGLKLGPDEAIRLRKAVYGLINAPLKWHQRLSRALRRVGFIPLQMDECVWILAEEVKKEIKKKGVVERIQPTTTLKRRIHFRISGRSDVEYMDYLAYTWTT